MEYRTLPHGGEQISIIGLGAGSLPNDAKATQEIIEAALEAGINFFDMGPSFQQPLYGFGKALEGKRDQVYIQMHFGALYGTGEYGWSQDVDAIRQQIEWNLHTLGLRYADFGFLHCIDTQKDLDKVLEPGGIWEYMQQLKEQGLLRHLGFSSHEPAIARQLIETGLVDLFMFSINPAYDFQKGEYANGQPEERQALYALCAEKGIGISVMKPFAGGQLLDPDRSLIGVPLTHSQCIQYALDQPAVMTVLPGVRNVEDLRTVLAYVDATPEEREYSLPEKMHLQHEKPVCVYCSHCQPCPKGLPIALINKYYDLARGGDALAKGHYEKLPLHASDCVHCLHCNHRCPFHVQQDQRMDEIAAYFGY